MPSSARPGSDFAQGIRIAPVREWVLVSCASLHSPSSANRTFILQEPPSQSSTLSSISELLEKVRGGVISGPDGVVDALDADLANNNHPGASVYLTDTGAILKMAADAAIGSDTCPSPEIADSRKRPLEGDTDNGVSKRSHYSTATPNNNNNSIIMNSTPNTVGKFHLNPPVNKIPFHPHATASYVVCTLASPISWSPLILYSNPANNVGRQTVSPNMSSPDIRPHLKSAYIGHLQ